MAADVSFLSYFLPIFAFLLVFMVMYALLAKSGIIGSNQWANIIVSFIVASIFISAAGAKEFVTTVTPWFAILVISLFFILVLVGFTGKMDIHKGLGWVFLVLLGIVFLVSAFSVFSYLITPYLPGSSGVGADSSLVRVLEWLTSSRVAGGILLIIISAVVAWILVKAKK